jgi:hypothetical protein
MDDIRGISTEGVMLESEVRCMLNMLIYSAVLRTFLYTVVPLYAWVMRSKIYCGYVKPQIIK